MARQLAAGPGEDGDPGLQPERTSLAWSRTVLGYVVVATVVLKVAPISGTAVLVSALAYQGVAVGIALRCAPRYRRDLRQLSTGRTPPVFEVFALSAVTAALALHWLLLSW